MKVNRTTFDMLLSNFFLYRHLRIDTIKAMKKQLDNYRKIVVFNILMKYQTH